jgi:hypothetical protein
VQPTAEQIDTYRRDGFVVLEQFLERDEVERLREHFAAFHEGWTFHGSPSNERPDRERRAVVSHMISTDTRWNADRPHPIYSKYMRPGEREMDDAFFPVMWQANGA